MLDWIFGCDICQDVCPWNRFAPSSSEECFYIRDALRHMDLPDVLALDEESFASIFAGTPLERTGRDAIVRNAAIAAVNLGDSSAIPRLQKLKEESVAFVSDAAEWALKKLAGTD